MEIVSTNTCYPFDELERLLYNSIHGLELSLTKLNCCFWTLRGSQSFKKIARTIPMFCKASSYLFGSLTSLFLASLRYRNEQRRTGV
jgi:hypothetical protein